MKEIDILVVPVAILVFLFAGLVTLVSYCVIDNNNFERCGASFTIENVKVERYANSKIVVIENKGDTIKRIRIVGATDHTEGFIVLEPHQREDIPYTSIAQLRQRAYYILSEDGGTLGFVKF